jgi:hypothetical protein
MVKKIKRGAAEKAARPKPAKLSAEESLKRMAAFEQRKEQFIAAIRKNKN